VNKNPNSNSKNQQYKSAQNLPYAQTVKTQKAPIPMVPKKNKTESTKLLQ